MKVDASGGGAPCVVNASCTPYMPVRVSICVHHDDEHNGVRDSDSPQSVGYIHIHIRTAKKYG